MFSVKFNLFILNLYVNLPQILNVLTQVLFSFISLILNFYPNKLNLSYSLASYLFLNLLYFSIIVIIMLFLFFLFLKFNHKIVYILIPIFSFSVLFLDTAYAEDTIIKISADTKSQEPLPFSQLYEASLSNDPMKYNSLAKNSNIDAFLGKNAKVLDSSYSLLHQTLVASSLKLHGTLALVSTDALIKSEVAYINESSLSESELSYYLKKFNSPIISKFSGTWWIRISDYRNIVLRTAIKEDYLSLILSNNNLHDPNFFQKSGDNFYALRLGDAFVFNTNTLEVVNSIEFKSTQRSLDPTNVENELRRRFKNSLLVDNQLYDSINKKMYYKACGDVKINLLDINLTINDHDLTEKFKLGKQLSINNQNRSALKSNLISATFRNISKFIIK